MSENNGIGEIPEDVLAQLLAARVNGFGFSYSQRGEGSSSDVAAHGETDDEDGASGSGFETGDEDTSDYTSDEEDDEDVGESMDDSSSEYDDDEQASGSGSMSGSGDEGDEVRRRMGGGGGATTSRNGRAPPTTKLSPLVTTESDLAHELIGATSAYDHRQRLPQKPSPLLRIQSPPSMPRLLLARESNLAGPGNLSPAQQRALTCAAAVPTRVTKLVDQMESRAYIGQFSQAGTFFVAAFQHQRRIRMYHVEDDFALKKDVIARNLRWTVTDTCLSPDQRFLLYSSITPVVHLVNVGTETWGSVESEANVTDVHEALHFAGQEERVMTSSFGIWSIKWSADNREVVAGTGDNSLYIYDLEAQRMSTRIEAHSDDINSVAFGNEASNLVYSASDDHLIKVWDRRCFGTNHSPAGVLVGHTEGLTHIDSKGDGRYLISNSKDQTIKLWDIRKMYTEQAHAQLPRPNIPTFNWDYRWGKYPGRGQRVRHPQDVSVMTLRGHTVLQTLIRAYFSPAETTGQRYVYTGSLDGAVHVYDLLTGKEAWQLKYHKENVRDCAWHPSLPLFVTTSFDGAVLLWEPGGGEHAGLEDLGADKLAW